MKPFVLLNGDAVAMLDLLPDASVQCCVTSPPYWGLRDYGTGKWEGGDAACEHSPNVRNGAGRADGVVDGRGQRNRDGIAGMVKARSCRCGAVRTDIQIGQETTPDAFVASLVAVFAEVHRVLKPDGTLWLNLGDSYNSSPGNGRGGGSTLGGGKPHLSGSRNGTVLGLKPKDLIGIPWRVAFALQSAGWYLRSDIIWHKPNPMPESVTDRPTRAHEYIFLLTKSAKYFYDANAIREQASPALIKQVGEGYNGNGVKDYATNGVQNGSAVKSRIIEGARKRIDKQRGHSRRHDGFNDRWDGLTKAEQMALGANKRDVWSVAPANFKEAHFATFPPKLITPCILAGSRLGDVVLDPFLGSGTTAEVALSLGRRCYGIELNPEYLPLIHKRVAAHLPKRALTLDDF